MKNGLHQLGNPQFHVTALIARWYAATSTLVWVNCAYPPAHVIDTEGNFHELGGHQRLPLGTGTTHRAFTSSRRRLEPGERLLLVSNGVLERRVEDGGTFGLDGIKRAVSNPQSLTAATTAMAILQAVSESWREPLADDGTVVVLQAT